MALKTLIENMISEMLSEEKADHIHKIMSKVADKYKDHQVADSSRPGGPNTSTFSAASSGKITHTRNEVTHPGNGMRPVVHDHFLKIGSGVHHEVHKKIVADVHKALIKAGHKTINYKGEEIDHEQGAYNSKNGLGHEGDFFRTKDKNGETYQVKRVHGTNWGGIGISKKPL